jgi:uncharacterized membrane protein
MTDKRSRTSEIVLWVVIVAFMVTFALLSVRRYLALASNGMDLGNVNQALWNTAHGNLLAFTNMAPVQNRLALHVEPILLLFVPLYWLGLGGPVSLLICQAAVVGLGALPLYWLARDRISGEVPFLALVFPVAYLLLPALEAAVMYDFHAVTLAPTFLLFAFYHVKKDRLAWAGLFALLAMACKEDMALTVAMLGLYFLLTRRWRFGLPALVGGLAWFAVAVLVVQPAFSPTGGNVQAGRYAWLGGSLSAVVDTALRRPGLVWDHLWRQADLLAYMGGLLLPTALLAALSPLTWLPTLPSLAVNLLSDDPFTWRLEEFHYAAPLAPFVLVSAVCGVTSLGGWVARRRPAAARYVTIGACGVLLIAAVGYHWGRGFTPLARPFQPWPVTDHDRKAEAVFRRLPPQVAAFAQSNLNPQVSGRPVVYQDPALLTELLQGTASSVVGGLPAPEYLLFDVSTLVNQDDFQRRVIGGLLESGYEPLAAEDGLLLLRPGAQRATSWRDRLPTPFYDFVRAGDAAPVYPMEADFGDAVRLLGFDLRFNRAEEVQPVLYFEPLRRLDEDYFICLYLFDEWNVVRGATVEDQPALVWYPPQRWQPGEPVRVVFNTLPWYTRDMSAYRLALGVMRGRDPWQSSSRLTPRLAADVPYAVRLPEKGSLLELARFRQVFGMPEGGPPERQFGAPQPQHEADVSFGLQQVRFLGYDVAPLTCDGTSASTCSFGLVLYWRAGPSIATDYTVFVHVVGEAAPGGARMWAQRDAQPESGAYPTRRWQGGEVVADRERVEVPLDMPAGSYDLVVGLYDPQTGLRLPVLDADGRVLDDKVVLPGAVAVPGGGE